MKKFPNTKLWFGAVLATGLSPVISMAAGCRIATVITRSHPEFFKIGCN